MRLSLDGVGKCKLAAILNARNPSPFTLASSCRIRTGSCCTVSRPFSFTFRLVDLRVRVSARQECRLPLNEAGCGGSSLHHPTVTIRVSRMRGIWVLLSQWLRIHSPNVCTSVRQGAELLHGGLFLYVLPSDMVRSDRRDGLRRHAPPRAVLG